jgi:uncharacterized membrane-anchored protein
MFRERPTALWVLLVTLGQLSARALIGGTALLVAPSGRLVGLSPAPLDGTVLSDFFVPGLVLFVVFGLGSAVASYGLYARRRWGWLAGVAVAGGLLVWILVEVVVGFHRPTLSLNLATAGAVLLLAVHPSVRGGERRAVDAEP